MSATHERLMSLSDVAELLGITGADRERGARRRILALGAPYRKDGRAMKMTEADYAALLELMRCPSTTAGSRPARSRLADKIRARRKAASASAAADQSAYGSPRPPRR